MAESHTLYNGGDVSVVYDSEGHVVDAGERITGNPNGRILSRLIASGQLTDLGPADADGEQSEAEEVSAEDGVVVDDATDDDESN